MTRQSISLRTKLAAALLTMKRPDENGVLQPIVSHEHAKLMSEDMVISLFNFDHYPIPHAQGGVDEAWNLQPLLISEHREKTAGIDIPQIAKSKRLASASADHQTVMASKIMGNVQRPAKPDKRVWPSQKIQSPRFEKRAKFNATTERRS